MLVSSIARFNALKNNAQTQASANSFNGVQQNNNKLKFNPFSINTIKSVASKLNILA